MKKLAVFALITGIAGCGVDGEPQPPKVSGSQTIGFSSESGPFSSTSLNFTFGGSTGSSETSDTP